ncbi:hypothetical protein GCM10023108_36060 [Saccharopolyspora hordei]
MCRMVIPSKVRVIGPTSGCWKRLLPPALLMVPLGGGGALAVPALTSLVLETVPGERAGTAAAVLNTSRQVGGAMSTAVFGASSRRASPRGCAEPPAGRSATALGATALLPKRWTTGGGPPSGPPPGGPRPHHQPCRYPTTAVAPAADQACGRQDEG